MGYMSNQWLNRGQGLRNRSYHPVHVRIDFVKPYGSWAIRNGVVGELVCRRGNDEYQTVHLSEAEADGLGSSVVDCMSKKAKEKLLLSLLRELSHAKLLRALALDLRKRVRLPKSR